MSQAFKCEQCGVFMEGPATPAWKTINKGLVAGHNVGVLLTSWLGHMPDLCDECKAWAVASTLPKGLLR